MDYQRLTNSINRGVVAPVYLFYGTEKYLMDQVIKKIKNILIPQEVEAFNLDIVDGEKISLRQAIDLANGLPVMAEKRLVIVDNANYFLANKGNDNKEDEKILLDYLSDPNTSCCLIFKVLGKVDKRKKIFKSIEKSGSTIEFASLTGDKLEQWISDYLKEKGKQIEREALMYLVMAGKEGLTALKRELEKLLMYSCNSKVINLEMVQDIVTKTAEIKIFDLIDCVANKEGKKALEFLQSCLSMGEPPMKLIYLLVRQFKIILVAKDLINQGYSEKQIRERLGVHPFVLTKGLRQGKKFTLEQLVNNLEKLLKTEETLKSSGGNPGELLENLIISLCYN